MSADNTTPLILLGVSVPFLGLAGYSYHLLQEDTKRFKEAKETPNFTPGALLRELKDLESNISQRFTNVDGKSHHKQGRFFIDGLATSPAPLSGKLDESMKLILSIYYKTDIFSNESLEDSKGRDDLTNKHVIPKDHITRKSPVLEIKDYESNESVRVRLGEKGKYLLLEEIAKREDYKKLNFLEKALVFLAMIAKFFSKENIKGLKIGVRERELGIKVDTLLSAYGTVTLDTATNKLTIDAADFISRDKGSLLKFYKDKITNHKVALWITLILGLGCAGSATYLLIKNREKKRNAK